MDESGSTRITGPQTPAGQSLQRRATSGGAMMLAGFGAGHVLRLISNLILVRFLLPEAFGLMAVAVSVATLANMMADLGINASIIRSKNSHKRDFLRTAWTMQILRNLFVWALLAIFALIIVYLTRNGVVQAGTAFADPRLPWIMVATGIQLPIAGLSSANQVMMERKLVMGRIIGLEIGTQITAMILTISAAVMGFDVWSFVIGTIGGAIVHTVFSHIIFPGPRMALRLDREHFGEIFSFGKWLLLASLFGFMTNKGDHFLLGWVMEKERFGLYAVATFWILAAFTVLETVVRRIFYPAFSEILRDRPHDLTRAYQKARLLVDAASVMLAFCAFFLADFAFSVIYPGSYGGVAYYVKLLAPLLLLFPYRLLGYAVIAAGNTKGFTLITAITGMATLILVPLAFSMVSEKAAILTYACITASSLPIAWRLGGAHIKINWLIETRILAGVAVMLALLIGVKP